MESEQRCTICARTLTGRQRRFCSRDCKNADTNRRHQSYLRQQDRGLRRKRALVEASGGGCVRCGYRRNLAALAWHHCEPSRKRFQLDLRNISNRSADEIRSEVEKCILVCANCHAEIHSPQLALT